MRQIAAGAAHARVVGHHGPHAGPRRRPRARRLVGRHGRGVPHGLTGGHGDGSFRGGPPHVPDRRPPALLALPPRDPRLDRRADGGARSAISCRTTSSRCCGPRTSRAASPSRPSQSLDETRFLLDLADRHPIVAGVVGWVDLAAPDLEAAARGASRATRSCAASATSRRTSPTTAWLVPRGRDPRDRDARRPRPRLRHSRLPAPAAAAAIALARALPEQRVRARPHAPSPRSALGASSPGATRPAALAELPHVWCKLSGLVTEARWDGWARRLPPVPGRGARGLRPGTPDVRLRLAGVPAGRRATRT